MGKAEDKRAAIVAQQAAREAAEREARRLAGPATPARKPKNQLGRRWSSPRPSAQQTGGMTDGDAAPRLIARDCMPRGCACNIGPSS